MKINKFLKSVYHNVSTPISMTISFTYAIIESLFQLQFFFVYLKIKKSIIIINLH